jgi:hypothetical protein
MNMARRVFDMTGSVRMGECGTKRLRNLKREKEDFDLKEGGVEREGIPLT